MTLWHSGKPPSKDNTEKKGFLEKPWASRAAAYLVPIKTLAQSEARWSQLYDLATQMIDPTSFEDMLDDNPTDGDPRTSIIISDDELE